MSVVSPVIPPPSHWVLSPTGTASTRQVQAGLQVPLQQVNALLGQLGLSNRHAVDKD